MRTFFAGAALLLVITAAARGADSPVKVVGLTTEHQVNPMGIGTPMPRLSWKIQSDQSGEKQTAYRILATPITYASTAPAAPLWDSGKVMSDQSVLIPWGGKPLGSCAQVNWTVEVWDQSGASFQSGVASFELGLLNPATDWKGQWITAELPRFDIDQAPLAKANWISAGSLANQAAAARTTITLPEGAKVLSATVDANADGLISFYANGQATKQGASSHTAPFHADFGPQLKPGKNSIVIGAIAVRRPTPQDRRNAIAAHLSIELADGQHLEFNTDEKWKATVNPTGGWTTEAFDDSAWPQATVLGAYAAQQVSASADSTIGPARYFRKTFTITKPILKARLYSTALGTYEASINDAPVNDHQFDPGWTDYTKRVMVQTTDITSLLKQGENHVDAVVTDGWFAGRIGWMGLAQYATVGRRPAFNGQLEITYADGTNQTIPTDATWLGGAGNIVGSDQQVGEVIDHSRAVDVPQWKPAIVDAALKTPLVPQVGPPVRRLMEIAPQKITRFGNTWVVDLGQNIVGHVRLTATGDKGTTINLSHAEMLNSSGLIYNENLRQAISLDTFTLGGGGKPETFEPHFTFHGFRYVQISGYPGTLTADNIKGIVVGSDNPATGTFECSSADVNRLYQNIVWGQRGNFLSVPTDCPQRDERMGWMGDAQVFAPTAARNADVAAFFTKWMIDVNDGQGPAGEFNNVNPRANQNQSYPVWGDAGVVIPWEMYLAYGDTAFLSDNYSHMAKWLDYNAQRTPGLILAGGVGDHLAPAGGGGGARGGPGGMSVTNVVDTAFFAHSAQIVSKAATILNKPDDAKKYDVLAKSIAVAFNKAFVGADGTISAGNTPGSQTCYLLALKFDLLPENLREGAAKKLIADVEQRAHLTTGFVGVGYLNPGLCSAGRTDLAYQLLLTDTYPSWLYSVKLGATTMWERWDGFSGDDKFQDSAMNSFNHYSFGAIGYWFYTGMGGIQVDESQPGYKQFFLIPQIPPAPSKITFAKTSLETPYGKITSNWEINDGMVTYEAVVPPNTTAFLVVPSPSAGSTMTSKIEPGKHTVKFAVPKVLK